MQRISHLILLIWLAVQAATAVEPYNYIGSSVSGVKQLYMNNTPLSQGTTKSFTINYATAKSSNPKIIIGLAGYQEHSDMSISYFKLSLGLNTLSQFAANVMTAGSSQVYMINIAYISLEDTSPSAFYAQPIDFNSFSIVDTGSGSRVENMPSNFFTLSGLSNYTLSHAFVFLIGFQIKAGSGNFNMYVRVSLNSNITFTTTVTTDSGCKIQYASIMHLFIDDTKFASPTLFLDSQIYDLTQSTQTIVPSHYTSFGYSMLGLLGWEGHAGSGSFNISFNQIASASSLTVTIAAPALAKVRLQYIFLAYNQCPVTYPYYQNGTKLACVVQCQPKQSLSPTNKVCIACASPCQECHSSPTNCTACISGYELNANVCTEIATANPQNTGSKLYLLSLLGIIPLLIVCNIYFCLYRRKPRIVQATDLAMQPSIDIS